MEIEELRQKILKQLEKNTTRSDFAALAKVKKIAGTDTVYKFLQGNRNLSFKTACKLAELAGLKVEIK